MTPVDELLNNKNNAVLLILICLSKIGQYRNTMIELTRNFELVVAD